MTDRIYVTYKPTIAPESYHAEINLERRDADGKLILHKIIDAGPANNRLSDKVIGAIEEKLRGDKGPSYFGDILAAERDPTDEDKKLAYETIAEGADLSSNWAKMQLFAHGFNRAGFAYRGDHQNSNSFGSALLRAGELPPATGVAHDPAGPPGELLDFFAPGLNEPLRAPIGRSYEPVNVVRDVNGNGNRGSSPANIAPLRAPERPDSFNNRFGNWGSSPADIYPQLRGRRVSSAFPDIAPRNPNQPAPPPEPGPPLGIFSGRPMLPSPLPPSVWGLPDNSDASGNWDWFNFLTGIASRNPTQPARLSLDDGLRGPYRDDPVQPWFFQRLS